jgi:hypothetical protein
LRVRKTRLQPIHDILSLDQQSHSQNHEAKQTEEKMIAKISSILTKIPAPINLAVNPNVLKEATQKYNDSKALDTPPNRPRASTPALTLSPVASKPRQSFNSNEPDVRVYHLHQPGKDVPIKLFIRLVGSEERVMVRVGGGWADLAEYLKEYALHHGRRSVSENKFELKGLPAAQTAASNVFDGQRSPSNSISGGTPGSKNGTPSRHRESIGHRKTLSSDITRPLTPDSSGRQIEPTPNSSNTHTPIMRSSSALSWREEESSLGLAGPKSKKGELSPQKRAWVDGMLNQARHISYEHKKSEAGEVGDLGKVGGTKRVFLKGRLDDS